LIGYNLIIKLNNMKNKICPICAKNADSSKSVEWAKKPCDDCTELMSKGFVLIGAVEQKTVDVTNPYRSGNVWCVDQSVADDLFAPNPAPPSGVSFIDINVAKELDLPNINFDA